MRSLLEEAEHLVRATPLDFPAYDDPSYDDEPVTIVDGELTIGACEDGGGDHERCLVCEATLPCLFGSERYIYDLITAIVSRGIAAVVLGMCEEHQACYLERIGSLLAGMLARGTGPR